MKSTVGDLAAARARRVRRETELLARLLRTTYEISDLVCPPRWWARVHIAARRRRQLRRAASGV
jgi:hypothetical protein